MSCQCGRKVNKKQNVYKLGGARHNKIRKVTVRREPILISEPTTKTKPKYFGKYHKTYLGTTTTRVTRFSESVTNWFFFTMSSNDRISRLPLKKGGVEHLRKKKGKKGKKDSRNPGMPRSPHHFQLTDWKELPDRDISTMNINCDTEIKKKK